MDSALSLDHLDAQQLRALAQRLMDEVAARDGQIARQDQLISTKQTHIDQLTHELAMYKRWRYGKRSEQLSAAQLSLLEETLDEDLAAIGDLLDRLLHHAHIVQISGESYRLKDKRKAGNIKVRN